MRRDRFLLTLGSIFALFCALFSFAPGASAASKEKVIYSFQGGSDGANPVSDLVADKDGNLYGTTIWGGVGCPQEGCGTVFELKRTTDGWQHQVLYSFTGKNGDGADPRAGLVFDSFGNLYGTTTLGGSDGGWGTVFELSQSSGGVWTEKTLYSFTDGSDGAMPEADLVFDARGNLYGTAFEDSGTNQCYKYGCGAVFELTPQADGSWTETTIYSFTGPPDGASPASAVVLDSSGNLYGTTEYGGNEPCYSEQNNGCGTAYKLTPQPDGTWKETILYNFVRGLGRGRYPSGPPFLATDGRIYGLSFFGGDGLGTAFELHSSPKGGWQQSDLHLFWGNPDGMVPVGRLVADSEGNLFGVSATGGMNNSYSWGGTVFRLEHLKGGWRETVIYAFVNNSSDGAGPQAGLLRDSQGRLYGTTEVGGSGTQCYYGSCGTVYEVTP